MKVSACAKHYAVHSGPEGERHTFNAVVSKRDLYGTYLPAFKKLVTEAKVDAVMGAYNRLFGEPCNASKLLLTDILRGEWGFGGHVVSDCGALTDIHANHKVTKDAAESAALALLAGCDMGCDHVYNYIPEAIERGLITEKDMDRCPGAYPHHPFSPGDVRSTQDGSFYFHPDECGSLQETSPAGLSNWHRVSCVIKK